MGWDAKWKCNTHKCVCAHTRQEERGGQKMTKGPTWKKSDSRQTFNVPIGDDNHF